MSKIEWQLPQNEDRHYDRMIHHNSYFKTTDVSEEEIMKNKELACKKCLSKLNAI